MPSLQTVLSTYLKIDRSPETNRQYSYILGKLVAGIGPLRDVRHVTFEELVDYLNALPVARSTRSGYISLIKAFFAWCVDMDYIPASPAQKLRRSGKGRSEPREARAIPAAELRAIIDYVRIDSPRNYALLLFMADTACRVGGLLSLTVDNLHLDARCAFLLEKGGKWQAAYFGDTTTEALERWLRLRPDTDHRFVWTGQGPDHAPLKDNAVRYVLRTLSKKCGCSREWFPHAIRHSVAYAWADAGIAPTVVQAKLGHSDPSITLVNYYPQDDNRLRMTSDRLALQALKTSDVARFAPVPLPAMPAKRAASK